MARSRMRKFCVVYATGFWGAKGSTGSIHLFAYNKTDAAMYIMANGVGYHNGPVIPSKIIKVKRVPQP